MLTNFQIQCSPSDDAADADEESLPPLVKRDKARQPGAPAAGAAAATAAAATAAAARATAGAAAAQITAAAPAEAEGAAAESSGRAWGRTHASTLDRSARRRAAWRDRIG